MLARSLPGPGNCRHDVEPGNAAGPGDALLVLAQETPQHGGEPDLQPRLDIDIRAVLVVPKLVSKLLALDRERDRDDDVRKSRAVRSAGGVALEAVHVR
jgi:hypothetical protein